MTLGRAGAVTGCRFGWYISVLWPCRCTDHVVLAKGGAVVIICLCVLFILFSSLFCFCFLHCCSLTPCSVSPTNKKMSLDVGQNCNSLPLGVTCFETGPAYDNLAVCPSQIITVYWGLDISWPEMKVFYHNLSTLTSLKD